MLVGSRYIPVSIPINAVKTFPNHRNESLISCNEETVEEFFDFAIAFRIWKSHEKAIISSEYTNYQKFEWANI